jgi:hypothetical protein
MNINILIGASNGLRTSGHAALLWGPMAKPEEPKIIFSLIGVSKKIERKEILRDISLSFYYGAKIGVLGFNGSGKSSLMRILALRDTEIDGRVHIEPGYEVGLLEQEPQLAAGRTVRECVEEGVKHLTDLVASYDATWDEINAAADDKAKDAIMARQGELQERIDAQGAWDVGPQVEMAMDALRCPPGEQIVDKLSGGRAPARGPGPPSPSQAADPSPRRADQPPGRGERPVAGAAPRALRGDGDRGHPRPVLPRQRRAVDP